MNNDDSKEKPTTDEITSVNSLSTNQNPIVKGAILALVSLLAIAVYVASSSDKSKTAQKEPEKATVSSILPHTPSVPEHKAEPQPPKEQPLPPLPQNMVVQNQKPLPVQPQQQNTKPVVTPFERKRSGGIIIAGDSSSQKTESGNNSAYATHAQPANPAAEESELSASLKATKISGVSASVLPNRNFLITKGSTLDCTLKTALDSSLSGLATCQLTRDIFSANGKVVLLDKGSLVIGEYSGGMKRGQNRLFLLWNRVETPNGVIIEINSPSIDPVGRTGIDGWVDNHFADRFAAAILVSLLQDATQAGQAYLQGITGNGGTNTTTNISSTPQASTEIVKSILQQQGAIPPTLNKNQGDHIQIMVARDLDFSSVYALKPVK